MDPIVKSRLTPQAVPVPYNESEIFSVASSSVSHKIKNIPSTSSSVPTCKSPSKRTDNFATVLGKTTENICPEKIPAAEVTRSSPSVCSTSDSPIMKVKTPRKTYNIVSPHRHGAVGCSPSQSLISHTEHISDTLFVSNLVDLPSTPRSSRVKRKLLVTEDITPRKKKLKAQIDSQKKKIKTKVAHISKLKTKLQHQRKHNCMQNVLDSKNFASKYSKALVKMQLETKMRRWLPDERKLALILYYKSPATYKFLRSQKIVLPSPSTVRKWIGSSKFKAGFNKNFFKQIKTKFETRSDRERTAVLCFDEMSIMENLQYSKEMDLIEGYEDLGSLGRSAKTARYALVFLVRGLYFTWKLPVGYFFSHSGVSGEKLATLIREVIVKLKESNVIVKVIVCDQGSNNRSAMNFLNVTVEKPYFCINSTQVFALYDTPHLFKSIRNNLLNGDFVIDGKVITFDDTKKVYEMDKKSSKSLALIKLTNAHICPNTFQKMNVKLAVQLFSHSVSAAIKTALDLQQLKSDTGEDTAEFVAFMDKLFDCLNSRTISSKNPYNAALMENSIVHQTLKDSLKILPNLTKVDKITKNVSKPPCFSGICQTVRGVLLLFESEKTKNKFILTNRLNQDVIENLFSIYRQKGGYNRNPTARQFRMSFRSNAINSLIRPPTSSNCEPDTDDPPQIIIIDSESQQVLSDTSVSTSTTTSDESRPGAETTLEDCAVEYFAGYLAKRCLDEFKCDKCKEQLTTHLTLCDKRQLLIINRNYSAISDSLQAPSENFRFIVNTALQCFIKYYEKFYFRYNIAGLIEKRIKRKRSVNEWLNSGECYEHRAFIIHLLIRVKLFFQCKSLSEKDPVTKKAKLRVLRNK